MRILINTPYLSLVGGVAQHYKGLQPYWTENVRHNQMGKRHFGSKWQTVLLYPFDLIKFCFQLLCFNPDVVLLNPSMAPKAIKRDLLCLKIANTLGKKTAIMFHGFHAQEVENAKDPIVKALNKSCLIMVLASDFKNILLNWGVTTPIHLVTTKVENTLVKDFDITSRTGQIRNILFLSRITKEKGIFIAIEVFKALAGKYPELSFTIAGDGKDLSQAKEMAKDLNIKFIGAVKGKDLIECYKNADCFLFTSYHEGMPAVVLEAMAFGLPVISRPVGGLKDIFIDKKMGYFVDSEKANDYLKSFENLLTQQQTAREISYFNYSFAQENLLASSVAKKIELYLNNMTIK